jgi:hypothetical protein
MSHDAAETVEVERKDHHLFPSTSISSAPSEIAQLSQKGEDLCVTGHGFWYSISDCECFIYGDWFWLFCGPPKSRVWWNKITFKNQFLSYTIYEKTEKSWRVKRRHRCH